MREESCVGGIICGRNPEWEESRVGGILCLRNPDWEEFHDYHQRILVMYLFIEPRMTQFDLVFENFIEITPL